jgi:hypothetical protein
VIDSVNDFMAAAVSKLSKACILMLARMPPRSGLYKSFIWICAAILSHGALFGLPSRGTPGEEFLDGFGLDSSESMKAAAKLMLDQTNSITRRNRSSSACSP